MSYDGLDALISNKRLITQPIISQFILLQSSGVALFRNMILVLNLPSITPIIILLKNCLYIIPPICVQLTHNHSRSRRRIISLKITRLAPRQYPERYLRLHPFWDLLQNLQDFQVPIQILIYFWDSSDFQDVGYLQDLQDWGSSPLLYQIPFFSVEASKKVVYHLIYYCILKYDSNS